MQPHLHLRLASATTHRNNTIIQGWLVRRRWTLTRAAPRAGGARAALFVPPPGAVVMEQYIECILSPALTAANESARCPDFDVARRPYPPNIRRMKMQPAVLVNHSRCAAISGFGADDERALMYEDTAAYARPGTSDGYAWVQVRHSIHIRPQHRRPTAAARRLSRASNARFRINLKVPPTNHALCASPRCCSTPPPGNAGTSRPVLMIMLWSYRKPGIGRGTRGCKGLVADSILPAS